jgi:MoxR-like ATPase
MTRTPRPYYVPLGNEEQVFTAAFRQGMSVLLKGPTGCGKTRFVEAMAYDLGRPSSLLRVTTTSPPRIWSGGSCSTVVRPNGSTAR